MNQLASAPAGTGYTNSESWLELLGQISEARLLPGLRHDMAACRTGRGRAGEDASTVQRLLAGDFEVQLPDDFLTKVDVASMAASLEVRAPFLDQKVVEHAWTLPDSVKLHWGDRKWLLKQIAARWVPRDVIFRRKMGFALPLIHWWRGELGDWLRMLMADSAAVRHGWISRQPVLDALDRHLSGENHHTRLWLVLWLELWFRLVIERTAASDLPRTG